jgi:hypothetical protein
MQMSCCRLHGDGGQHTPYQWRLILVVLPQLLLVLCWLGLPVISRSTACCNLICMLHFMHASAATSRQALNVAMHATSHARHSAAPMLPRASSHHLYACIMMFLHRAAG